MIGFPLGTPKVTEFVWGKNGIFVCLCVLVWNLWLQLSQVCQEFPFTNSAGFQSVVDLI